jgi:alanine dehydrogenase
VPALKVGVPKELKEYENRVSLTPRSVASMVSHRAQIVVESGAGARCGFSDDEYASAGASIAANADELYSTSDLIVKVKEIQIDKGEHLSLRPKHTVFCFNHFESSMELTEAAAKSGATFISFEKVVDTEGNMPILMPMSRIAGTLSGMWAGCFSNHVLRHGNSLRMKAGFDQIKAKIASDFEEISSTQKFSGELALNLSLQDKMVVIFGGGTVGESAAKICGALGAKLLIGERRDARRKHLQNLGLNRCTVSACIDGDMLKGASVIIGATYDREKADRVIDEDTLKNVSETRKKVIIDVSIDQGGNFPYVDQNGRYSPNSMGTIMNPAQLDNFGNVFVRVPNMPSAVPRYAAGALSSAIAPYVQTLASGAIAGLDGAVSIKGGRVLDGAVSKAHRMSVARL